MSAGIGTGRAGSTGEDNSMTNLRALSIVILTLFVFGSTAIAKPSDWADIVDPNPKQKMAYDSSRRIDRAPIKSARAEPTEPTKVEKASKADKKVSKAKAKKTKAKARKTKAKRGRR
ncbi:MAG: hypothetical protein ACKV2T_06925 [Kofleriaceae bacterium]